MGTEAGTTGKFDGASLRNIPDFTRSLSSRLEPMWTEVTCVRRLSVAQHSLLVVSVLHAL